MALSPTKIIPVIDVNCLNSANAASEVYPPLSGTPTTANDVGAGEQILRNQTHTLNELKVNRAGDTMTGSLVITTATADGRGLNATGNGSGAGVRGVGGATGPGGVFVAGSTGDVNGVESTASGAGYGLFTGPGVASTTTAPTIGVFVDGGGLRINATSPNANVNPGADNTVFPQSINSSSCSIDTDGAGNVTLQTEGFNVGTVSIFGTDQLVVRFKRVLPGSTYRVSLGEYGPYKVELVNGSRAAIGYTLKVRSLATNAYVNVTTTSVTVFVTTTGF